MEENKKNISQNNDEQNQDNIISSQEERKKQIDELFAQLKRQASVEEIHQRTHIALFKVESILKCDYKQFDRTTAIGFIRILEREYKLDLNPWIVDYDCYCQEYGLLKQDEYDSGTFTDVNMQIDRYEKRTSVKWLNISIGAIIFICGFGYLLFNYYSSSIQEGLFDKPESKREVLVEQIVELNVTEVNESVLDHNATTAPAVLDHNATTVPTVVVPEAAETLVNPEQNQTKQPENVEPEEIVFSVGENVAGRQLWLGMLYVNTKKRAHQIVTGHLAIKGGEPILFVTGHGRFGVSAGDVNLNLQGSSPLYLYYNPGENIRVVSEAEFKVINGGRGW